MVVDVLGPIFCSAVVTAELVLDLWCEPFLFDVCSSTFGASGLWENGVQTRCTVAGLRGKLIRRPHVKT